jgi:GntR family transcriptional regulator, arabinose operon transcriptional repressor
VKTIPPQADFSRRTSTKFERLHVILKKQILHGEVKYKEKFPPENKLSSIYSISRPTVAKAMAELEKEGLIERRVGDGTYVIFNSNAVSNIGLLIPNLGSTNAIFEPICAQIALLAHEQNIDLIWGIAMSEWDNQIRKKIEITAQRYIDKRVNGVVYVPVHVDSQADDFNETILHKFDQAEIPVVLLDRDIGIFPNRSKYDFVGIDNYKAGFLVTQHLLKSRPKRVDFIAESVTPYTIDLRIQGYQNALLRNGIVPLKQWIHLVDASDLTQHQELFDTEIEAVVCAKDALAANYLTELGNRSIRVPQSVKIASFDGLPLSQFLNPPLTTYQQPCDQIGGVLFKTLMNRIRDKTLQPQTIFVNGTLVIRQSSQSTYS